MGTCRNCGLDLSTGAYVGPTCPRCSARVVVPIEPTLLAPGTVNTALPHAPRDTSGATRLAVDLKRVDAPERVGKYELRGELGRGGMGVVYEAWDTQLLRRVALKMVLGEQDPDSLLGLGDSIHRFLREARSAAKLDHPGIVRVHDVFEEAGRHFLVLEFVDGASFHKMLGAEGRVPLPRALEVLRDVALALSHAHARGVLHRDLKPSNVLITREGVAKLSDFGLARDLSGSDASFRTASGTLLGTPQYMSPEQAEGDLARLGAATDIWAMGVMLYQALTGRTPFDARSLGQILLRIVVDDPVPPRRLNAEVSPQAETVCLKCLEKVPALRYRTAEELAADLTALIELRNISAKPPPAWRRAARWVRRHPVTAILAPLVVAGALVGRTIHASWREREAAKGKAAIAQEELNAQIDVNRLCENALFLLRGDPASREAEAILVEAAARPCALARPWVLLAGLHRATGEFERAAQDLDAAGQREPDNLQGLMERYLLTSDTRFLGDMVPVFRIRELAPTSDLGRWAAGLDYHGEKRFEEAHREFQAAAALNPALAEVPFSEGCTYIEERKWEEARACFVKGLALDPRHSRAWSRLGDAEFGLRRYAEAEEAYSKAIERRPENPNPYNGRALARNRLGRGAEALADLTEALRLTPLFKGYEWSTVPYLTNRGSLYREMGRNEEAEADFTAALDQDPSNWFLLQARAATRCDTGDLTHAIQDIDRCLEVRPGFAEGHRIRGFILNRMQRWSEAAVEFRAYLDMAPGASDRAQVEEWIRTCDARASTPK